MPGINFKSEFQEGRKGLGSIISGLDWHKIVDASYEVATIKATSYEKDIDFNTNKKAAYRELESMVRSYQTACEALRNNLSISNSSANALQQKIINISTSLGEDGSTYAAVTTNTFYKNSDFTMTISSLAAAKLTQSTTFSSISSDVTQNDHSNTLLFTIGDFSITGPSGTSTITVASGDSVSSIAQKIEVVKSTTGVRAKIVKPTATSYVIQLESMKTGASNGFNITDNDNILNNIFKVSDGNGGYTENIIKAPTDASFTFNSAIVTRPTNVITDYTDGLSISLKAVPPNNVSLSVNMSSDVDKAAQAIATWADAFNELVRFQARQEERVSMSQYAKTAYLHNDQLLQRVMSDLSSITFSSPVGDDLYQWQHSLDFVNVVAPFGIRRVPLDLENPSALYKTNKSLLEIDPIILKQSLSNNIEAVQQWFEFQYKESTESFTIIKRGVNLPLSIHNFDITVDPIGGTASFTVDGTNISASYTQNSDPATGGTIFADDDTIMAGYVIIFTGSSPTNTDVYITRGIADRLSTKIIQYFAKDNVNPVTGKAIANVFELEANALDNKIQGLTKDILNIRAKAESKRNTMQDKFSRMEAAVAQSNNMLEMFESAFANNNRKR